MKSKEKIERPTFNVQRSTSKGRKGSEGQSEEQGKD
jgi:hypothetical protein